MAAGEPLHAGIAIRIASDCCEATVFVDRAVNGERCSRCDRLCTPVRYQVVEELSSCCGAGVTVAGRTTHYWVCTGCALPCDVAAS